MSKLYFDYVDVKLGAKGNYTPSYTTYIPLLAWKAEIHDEVITGIKTPNSFLNFWYIEISDITVTADIQNLLARPNVNSMKELTIAEAKAMLEANGYIDWGSGYEITPAWTWIDWEVIPAVYLIID